MIEVEWFRAGAWGSLESKNAFLQRIDWTSYRNFPFLGSLLVHLILSKPQLSHVIFQSSSDLRAGKN